MKYLKCCIHSVIKASYTDLGYHLNKKNETIQFSFYIVHCLWTWFHNNGLYYVRDELLLITNQSRCVIKVLCFHLAEQYFDVSAIAGVLSIESSDQMTANFNFQYSHWFINSLE